MKLGAHRTSNRHRSSRYVVLAAVLGCAFFCSVPEPALAQTVGEVWVQRYDGPASSSDRATALAVDGGGSVYVAGNSWREEATIKYSSAGDTVWVRRNLGPLNASALAVDDSGNVYVTGWDYVTIKYSSAGDTVWVRRYNGPDDGRDSAAAICVDDSGNVYVTGRSKGSGTGRDYATIKYSPVGDTVWVRRYNGPANGDDWATGLGVDDNLSVYVTGESRASGTGRDYATIKYSSVGDTVWIRRYDGPGRLSSDYGDSDHANALAVDDSGNVYVTGYSWGAGTYYDYATLKYSNPTGDVNCDGIIDLVDVVLLGNYVDGLIDLEGTCGGGQADVDSDGDIDEDDYNLLYDVVAGVGP